MRERLEGAPLKGGLLDELHPCRVNAIVVTLPIPPALGRLNHASYDGFSVAQKLH